MGLRPVGEKGNENVCHLADVEEWKKCRMMEKEMEIAIDNKNWQTSNEAFV